MKVQSVSIFWLLYNLYIIWQDTYSSANYQLIALYWNCPMILKLTYDYSRLGLYKLNAVLPVTYDLQVTTDFSGYIWYLKLTVTLQFIYDFISYNE